MDTVFGLELEKTGSQNLAFQNQFDLLEFLPDGSSTPEDALRELREHEYNRLLKEDEPHLNGL